MPNRPAARRRPIRAIIVAIALASTAFALAPQADAAVPTCASGICHAVGYVKGTYTGARWSTALGRLSVGPVAANDASRMNDQYWAVMQNGAYIEAGVSARLVSANGCAAPRPDFTLCTDQHICPASCRAYVIFWADHTAGDTAENFHTIEATVPRTGKLTISILRDRTRHTTWDIRAAIDGHPIGGGVSVLPGTSHIRLVQLGGELTNRTTYNDGACSDVFDQSLGLRQGSRTRVGRRIQALPVDDGLVGKPGRAGHWIWSANPCKKLPVGAILPSGGSLLSADGKASLVMQADGNLVLSGPRGAMWASNTAGHPGAILTTQPDGNIVIIARGSIPVWSSATNGLPPLDLELHDDGNLVAYGPGHVPRWQSGTHI